MFNFKVTLELFKWVDETYSIKHFSFFFLLKRIFIFVLASGNDFTTLFITMSPAKAYFLELETLFSSQEMKVGLKLNQFLLVILLLTI